MKVLVTSSRTPFAIDMVRKLAESGHDVYASDTYPVAPGSHSRFLAGHFVTAVPRTQTARFVADVQTISRDHGIEVVVPAFEESFYLAANRARLDGVTQVYTGQFADLARLHDKSTFQRLVVDLGVPTAETVVARSADELRAAIERFPRYFARAAFSRGGVLLLTNTGPLAGHIEVEDVSPTEQSPWLVQPFVDGPMHCTYSTLHDGRVTAHCAYRAPRQWDHSTGIGFQSVDAGASLPIVERIAGHLGYTGQLSFDFIESPDGLSIVECNPRATDGVLLMSPRQFSDGVLEPQPEAAMVPAGEQVQLDIAVFGQMFQQGLREIPHTLHDLAEIQDASHGWHDALPNFYSVLAYLHHERLSLRDHEKLFEAMYDDICWNGEPIAGMSEQDAAVLKELEGTGAQPPFGPSRS